MALRAPLPMLKRQATLDFMFLVAYALTKVHALFVRARVVLLWVQQWSVGVDMMLEATYLMHKEPGTYSMYIIYNLCT